MKNYRIRYFAVLAAVAVIAVYFANAAFLATGIIMVLLPVVLHILLVWNVKKIRPIISINEGLTINNDIGLRLSFDDRRISSAVGLVIIEAEFRNNIFDFAEQKRYVVSIGAKQEEYQLPYEAALCGRLAIKIKSIKICDFLGLFMTDLKKVGDIETVIYPRDISLTAIGGKNEYKRPDLGLVNAGKRGNDNSEIFDLKEYQSGDPIKNIHWKLSAKKDELVVKQNSDLFSYNVLCYMDTGLEKEGIRLKNEQISKVLEVGINLGKSITTADIKHRIAVPVSDELKFIPVDDISGFYKVVQQTILSGINTHINSNQILEKYSKLIIGEGYSKLILVCWEVYPAVLEYLSNFMDITVIVLYDHNKSFSMIEKENLHIVTLADDKVFDGKYTVQV